MMATLSERLIAFNSGRMPEMVMQKYHAMSENIFRFFRGTCHLFYEDLSKEKNIPPSPCSWTCGDLHIENFGSYKADNKLVYFDLNDFDESIKAPALWEVLRIITSILIAFYTLDIEQAQAINLAALFIKSYSASLSTGKAVSIEPRTSKGIVSKFLKSAENSGYTDILKKHTRKKKKKVILSLKHERHFKIGKGLKRQLGRHITEWIKTSSDGPYNYSVEDAVFRLAGTGSIGSQRYLVLLKSTNTKNRYLIADMKEAFPSSLIPYISIKQPEWETEAHRIISIQQRMQYMSASLLSATVFNGKAYVIQELQPFKDTLRFDMIKDSYRNLYQVIDDMGILTASSQIRSSGTDGSATIDALKAFGISSEAWGEKALSYALMYCDRTKKYYGQFLYDYRSGKLLNSL